MSKLVAHLGKFKMGNLSGAQAHNDRRYRNHSNKDINVDKSHLNYDLVDAQGSYKARFDEQMRKYYTSPRKVRSDATVCDEWVFGSDAEFFADKSDEEQRRYFESIKDFMADRYGNHVIYATVHVDEQTPHMHLGLVPLTDDGRLSHKSIFNKTELTKVHRDLHKHLTQQGFELDAPDKSVREHLSVAEYKLQKSNEALQKNEEAQKVLEQRGERYLTSLDKITKEKFSKVDAYAKQRLADVAQREQVVAGREMRADEREQDLQSRESQADAREQALSVREADIKSSNTILNQREMQIDARSQQLDVREQELQSRESQVEAQASKNVSERNKLREVHEGLKKMQTAQRARETRLNEREADLSNIATDKGDALRLMLYRDFIKRNGLNVGDADVFVHTKYAEMSQFIEPQQQQQSNSYGYGLEL